MALISKLDLSYYFILSQTFPKVLEYLKTQSNKQDTQNSLHIHCELFWFQCQSDSSPLTRLVAK